MQATNSMAESNWSNEMEGLPNFGAMPAPIWGQGVCPVVSQVSQQGGETFSVHPNDSAEFFSWSANDPGFVCFDRPGVSFPDNHYGGTLTGQNAPRVPYSGASWIEEGSLDAWRMPLIPDILDTTPEVQLGPPSLTSMTVWLSDQQQLSPSAFNHAYFESLAVPSFEYHEPYLSGTSMDWDHTNQNELAMPSLEDSGQGNPFENRSPSFASAMPSNGFRQQNIFASTDPIANTPAPPIPQSICAQSCGAAFGRDSDRIRHEASVHGVNGLLHLCPVQGCCKSVGAGYTRKDKLTEHLWRKHGNLGFVKRV